MKIITLNLMYNHICWGKKNPIVSMSSGACEKKWIFAHQILGYTVFLPSGRQDQSLLVQKLLVVGLFCRCNLTFYHRHCLPSIHPKCSLGRGEK